MFIQAFFYKNAYTVLKSIFFFVFFAFCLEYSNAIAFI